MNREYGEYRMRCAVLGANGYIGSHLVNLLSKNNHYVQAYDIQSKSKFNVSNYRFLDVSCPQSFDGFNTDVDVIFCFSGITGTFDGFDKYQDFINVNEVGILNLLNKIRLDCPKAKLVFPSTRLVYQGSDNELSEDSAKTANTVYAVNKIACELYIKAYNNAFGIPYKIFRICVPYGNWLNVRESYGTMGFFLGNARQGKDITLYGDGLQRRTWTSVWDVCNQIAMVSLMPAYYDGIFNISGENFSLAEVAHKIAAKYKIKVKFVDWPADKYAMESGSTVFDSSRIEGVIGNKQFIYTIDKWLGL
ncbi:MAG: NAD(P)-dependent oxidoreductase [Kiritimatiellae bacterium]|jgi:UDP-glucose 4-epimerase|nr:NAD(P)-dependent oxidoreductase [Kiritimatiellia bacterium]